MSIINVAGGVIKNEIGEILLLYRNQTHLSQWELPGGKIEAGENAKETVIRELQEELGIEVSIERYIGAELFKQIERHWNYEWFNAKIEKGSPTICEPEIFNDLRYWNPKDILESKENISPNVLNLLNQLNT